ncbi:MAG: ornithine carbamoyltransferase [Desulfovibrionaceae bacterium]|nr:ornithine carbamoyltransferase [Desulfovibrionaceae bacterium]
MRHVLTIKDLGEETCWLLVQQAMGIPDAKSSTDFMAERVALLVFAQSSLAERMCVTAAVRQMSGSTIYQGTDGSWRREVMEYQEHLMPIFGYYVDCLYTYGLPVSKWEMNREEIRFPVINAGSPDAHPAHVLADIACMLRASRTLEGVTAAWIGCNNGTLHSLIEAMAWFPFSLRVALPPHLEVSGFKEAVQRMGHAVSFVETPEEAIRDANFVFAGCRGEMDTAQAGAWKLDRRLMGLARPNAGLLLSASPIEAIPLERELLASPTSLLTRQAENRLRVHKRILHWVFQENEQDI